MVMTTRPHKFKFSSAIPLSVLCGDGSGVLMVEDGERGRFVIRSSVWCSSLLRQESEEADAPIGFWKLEVALFGRIHSFAVWNSSGLLERSQNSTIIS